MTPGQPEGACALSSASLPADATIARVTPCASTAVMALAYPGRQSPLLPKLMLMTCAGLELSGTPGTCNPPAHARPSMASDSAPSHLPITRTGSALAAQLIP